MSRAIPGISWKDEATNTSGAMRTARQQMFLPEKGDRPNAPNIAIVITGNPLYISNIMLNYLVVMILFSTPVSQSQP